MICNKDKVFRDLHFFYSNENRKDEKENEDIPDAVETASGTMMGN